MEWGVPVDLQCPNFVQVPDYSTFKSVDHYLKYRKLSALSVKINLYPIFLQIKN